MAAYPGTALSRLTTKSASAISLLHRIVSDIPLHQCVDRTARSTVIRADKGSYHATIKAAFPGARVRDRVYQFEGGESYYDYSALDNSSKLHACLQRPGNYYRAISHFDFSTMIRQAARPSQHALQRRQGIARRP